MMRSFQASDAPPAATLPVIIASGDGSVSATRDAAGFAAIIIAKPSSGETHELRRTSNRYVPGGHLRVTPWMAELAAIATSLSSVRELTEDQLIVGQHRVILSCDCQSVVNELPAFHATSTDNIGAGHLTPLFELCHGLLMTATSLGHEVIIRCPVRGRRARTIERADALAREARHRGAGSTEQVSVDLGCALARGSAILAAAAPDVRRLSLEMY